MNFPQPNLTNINAKLWIEEFKVASVEQKQKICMTLLPLWCFTIQNDNEGICRISLDDGHNPLEMQEKLISLLQPILEEGQKLRTLIFSSDEQQFTLKLTDFTNHTIDPSLSMTGDSFAELLKQIPLDNNQKKLKFTGCQAWREDTCEEWVMTSFFKISILNLEKLKAYFSTLYDWSAGTEGSDIKFLTEGDQVAISGLMADHAVLDFDEAEARGLDSDDAENLEESVILVDLLKELAEKDQEITVCAACMSKAENIVLFEQVNT